MAANEELVPVHELYRYCEIAREMLKGEYGVGRVIARPFLGHTADTFYRTTNRHDPVSYTHLDVYKRQNPDGAEVDADTAECIVAKNRHGETSTVPLLSLIHISRCR